MGLKFYDLYDNEGLQKINDKFYEFFAEKNADLFNKFLVVKGRENSFKKSEKDSILLESAKILEDFLIFLFNIEKENSDLKKFYQNLAKISFVKRDFVQRAVSKKFKNLPENFNTDGFLILKDLGFDFALLESANLAPEFLKNSFFNEEKIVKVESFLAEKISLILNKDLNESQRKLCEKLTLYCVWALYAKEGRKFHENGALFNLPQKIDYENLVEKNPEEIIVRDDFNLTDNGFDANKTLSEANYCIFCHKQEKDSCRTGLYEKQKNEFDEKEVKQNPLGINLEGCPLDQKISEMNLLKSEFFSIASVAVAMIDNPLLAGTGHRICNDCMKSCIFQKQDPVNIPQIETKSLKDLLSLPYGFEIYSLLTRWNPLKNNDETAKEHVNKRVLVAGLGPAGYLLSHYLLNEGFDVVAIDGLKIEPINPEICGVDLKGDLCNFKPIKYIDEIYQPLQSRLIQGFGGVAEYGITSRWDKNFLTIIRLLLERRENFRMFGGLRFGSSIDDEIAFNEYEFDHVALCIGAGKPNIIDIKNNFSKGVRMASDFLMALQLTGAFKKDLFTNLQVRLPIIVVGAGLTAVDTACEAQQYYILQIEKISYRYQNLVKKFGEDFILQQFSAEEKIILNEFLQHFQELEKIGKKEFIKKYHAKILYRKKLQNSPSYRLNHEELNKAFEQGITFVENQEPQEAILDEFNHIKAIKCKSEQVFQCKSLLVATGTSPNVSVKIEDGLNLDLTEKYFSQIDSSGKKIAPSFKVKQGEYSFFTRIDDDKKSISFFGDLHPNFEGNVVKAMASAKIGYKEIVKLLNSQNSVKKLSQKEFFDKINEDFIVKIHKIEKISQHLNQIEIKAPLLAKKSEIGQIFRLQNYHSLAQRKNDHILAMEGIAVTALNVDKENGILTGIVLDFGGSTSFIKNFEEGENCIFMGPSGKPTEVKADETVLLIGGGRGNMPLTAIAEAFKAKGSKVIFCASYRKNEFVARQKKMESAADIMIYAIEEEEPNLNLQQKSFQFRGNVIQALQQYFSQNHQKIDRILTIGNDKMMAEIAKLRHENIVPEIANAKIALASLNASMQCMMKGVCSQCLQKRINENGEVEYFYGCTDQDQNMDRLDFKHLSARCDQNSMQEKLTRMWIENIRS